MLTYQQKVLVSFPDVIVASIPYLVEFWRGYHIEHASVWRLLIGVDENVVAIV